MPASGASALTLGLRGVADRPERYADAHHGGVGGGLTIGPSNRAPMSLRPWPAAVILPQKIVMPPAKKAAKAPAKPAPQRIVTVKHFAAVLARRSMEPAFAVTTAFHPPSELTSLARTSPSDRHL
jgi:hypothetical protein